MSKRKATKELHITAAKELNFTAEKPNSEPTPVQVRDLMCPFFMHVFTFTYFLGSVESKGY